MDSDIYWFIFFIFICLILGTTIIVLNKSVNISVREACKKIGFEDYDYFNEEIVCVDKQDNIHFVKFDCDYWSGLNCKAKAIKVGEVWGKE